MKKTLLVGLSLLAGYSWAQTPNIIDTYIGGVPIKTVIANSSDGVLVPRDLDFHPSKDELWVVLKETENTGGKTVLIKKPGKTGQTELVQKDGNAWHFMSLPTGIAFSPNEEAPHNNFATSPGVFDANHNGGSPFTGPSLWSSNPLIYAQAPPPGGNGSHYDMLHESPYSMGICADHDNIFWVNDGYHNTLYYYDFKADHGPGGSYHGDAIVRRYTGVGLVEDPTQHIVSHLELDQATKWIYIADTGNKRVVRVLTTSGSKAGNLSGYEAVAEYANFTGFSQNNFVANTGATSEPAGIAIVGNRLLVSDHSNGDIQVYALGGTTGTLLGTLKTNAAGIMGLAIEPTTGKIWYVNASTNQVIRLEPNGSSTGVNEFAKNEIGIFPNPVSGNRIFISGLTIDYSSIKIFNMMGQLAMETTANESTSEIDVTSLAKGTYIVQVVNNNNNESTTKKLVVVK